MKQLIPGNTTIEEKADILLEKGVKNVIITLGHKGCYLKNAEHERYFPAADFYPWILRGRLMPLSVRWQWR